MKTTDLIPLILYQLVDGDKYGYEIVKQIEDSSNGSITIKQPTLYSVLKKLEHGKFISSYWQDSEIGGKRHYYKLTDNGKAQLDALPPFEQLIKDVVSEPVVDVKHSPTESIDENNNIADENIINVTVNEIDNKINPLNAEQNLSSTIDNAMDNLSVEPDSQDNVNTTSIISNHNFDDTNNNVVLEPIKIDLTTNTNNINVALDTALSSIDNSVKEIDLDRPSSPSMSIFDAIEPANYDSNDFVKKRDEGLDVDIDNAKLQNITDLSDNLVNADDGQLAPTLSQANENVTPLNNKLYNKLTPSESLVKNTEFEAEEQVESISFDDKVKCLNYADFATDKASIKRKKAISKHVQKMCYTVLSLLIMLILSVVVGSKYSFSKLYYVCAIIVCLIIVLYPILLLRNLSKLRLKYCSKPFKYNVLKDMLIKLCLFLIVVIGIFAYNLSICSSIGCIFRLNNYANLYAPISFGLVLMLDFVYSYLLYKNYKK